MTNIQPRSLLDYSPEELTNLRRKRADELVERGIDHFRAAVRPIYGAISNNAVTHIGSCVLLEIDGKKLLLTAAHVTDENSCTSLYVGGDDELVLIESVFTTTPKPDGSRDKDHYDIAVSVIPDAMLGKMNGLKFITENEIDTVNHSEFGCLYTAFGYPNSKNKRYDLINRTIRPSAFPYANTAARIDALSEELGHGGNLHIGLGYGKYSLNEDRQQSSSIAPVGMSGGALFHVGRPAKKEVLLAQSMPDPKLVGMVIELRPKHSVLLSTHMSFVLPFIKKALSS